MALVQFDDLSTYVVNIPISQFTFNERLKRAIKIFFTLILISILAVLIPILHFVLVPAAFIAAFVMGYIRYSQTAIADFSSIICSKCSVQLNEKKIYLKPNQDFIKLYCFNCRRYFKIVF